MSWLNNNVLASGGIIPMLCLVDIHWLHVLSQYCFERSFCTDDQLSILLNASLLSTDEDFIRRAFTVAWKYNDIKWDANN
jgi:hypothetical protein